MNKAAYETLIADDLEWLAAQPRTLEREHIELIVKRSTTHEYSVGSGTVTAPIDSPAGPVEAAPAIDGKRLDTEEARRFWSRAEANAADVATWPDWKRHAVSSCERTADGAPAVDPVEQARAVYEAAHRAECAAWSAFADALKAAREAKRAMEEAEKAGGGK